jgi:transcriptional regulator with XRE-family HTH domain
MKITAVTRFKNGVIYETCQKLGWSTKELATRAGISYTGLINFVSLKKRIGEASLVKVQRAFGEAGIYVDLDDLCPEEFKGFGKSITLTQTQDVDTSHLLQFYENTQSALEDKQELIGRLPELKEALVVLGDKNRKRFELLLDGHTMREISENLGEEIKTTQTVMGRDAKCLRWEMGKRNEPNSNESFMSRIKKEVGYVGRLNDVTTHCPLAGNDDSDVPSLTKPKIPKKRKSDLHSRLRAAVSPNKHGNEKLPYDNVISCVSRSRDTHGIRVIENLTKSKFVNVGTGIWVKIDRKSREWTVRTCYDTKRPQNFYLIISRR